MHKAQLKHWWTRFRKKTHFGDFCNLSCSFLYFSSLEIQSICKRKFNLKFKSPVAERSLIIELYFHLNFLDVYVDGWTFGARICVVCFVQTKHTRSIVESSFWLTITRIYESQQTPKFKLKKININSIKWLCFRILRTKNLIKRTDLHAKIIKPNC